MHSLEWKCINFNKNFTEVYSQGSIQQYSSTGLDNGMMSILSNRRQVIIWTNGDHFTDSYMRHLASMSWYIFVANFILLLFYLCTVQVKSFCKLAGFLFCGAYAIFQYKSWLVYNAGILLSSTHNTDPIAHLWIVFCEFRVWFLFGICHIVLI